MTLLQKGHNVLSIVVTDRVIAAATIQEDFSVQWSKLYYGCNWPELLCDMERMDPKETVKVNFYESKTTK